MQLITPELREQLIANGKDREGDHVPVLKCFHPVGAATWLIYAMDPEDNDYLHCLADLGMGFPELGGVLLSELEGYRGPLGLGIERDLYFKARYPISVYAEAARMAERIVESGPLLDDAARTRAARTENASGAVAAHSALQQDAVREVLGDGSATPRAMSAGILNTGDLPAGHDRHRDALLIVDPGACNPSGVALSLFNACRQVIAEGGDQRTDPAVRLIATQLSHLVNSHADLDTAEYSKLIEACKSKARAR
ncbi:MAG: DUF2958 domain-containing protein [Rhodospirillaceae bacterium]|nr:DUF2958 domain-containing protein [Rhodospirillaceae bacterium]